MRFISLNADFSNNNIGNSNKAEVFIFNGGITDDTQKHAVRNFEKSLKDNNIWDYFDVIRLFGFSNSLADGLNLKNPILDYSSHRAIFNNDSPGAHTVDGFEPDPDHTTSGVTERYAISNYTLPFDLTNFHVHAYNKTSEESAAGNYYLLGMIGENIAGVADYHLFLSRNSNGNTQFAFGISSSALPVSASGYDKTKTGLLSGWKIGSALKMSDGGEIIASGSNPSAIKGGGGRFLNEGAYGDNNGYYASSSKIQCIMYGSGIWDIEKENLLKNAITGFITDLNV